MVKQYKSYAGYDTAHIAPLFQLFVRGRGDRDRTVIGLDITQFIESVSFEDAENMAAKGEIVLHNPEVTNTLGGSPARFSPGETNRGGEAKKVGIFTDTKLFQPPNSCILFMGHSPQSLGFVGTFEIVRVEQDFPESSSPKIVITGYSADYRMMDGVRPSYKEIKKVQALGAQEAAATFAKQKYKTAKGLARAKDRAAKKSERVERDVAAVWPAPSSLRDVVKEKADLYNFSIDFPLEDDITFYEPIRQKASMSDYALLKGLSNLTGYQFWVDADEFANWTLHFRKPDDLGLVEDIQENNEQQNFNYAIGGSGSLRSFKPEYTLRDQTVKMKIEAYSPEIGFVDSEEFDPEEEPVEFARVSEVILETIEETAKYASQLRVYFGDFQITFVGRKRFRTPAQLRAWGRQWYRRNRDLFIMGDGVLLGDTSIRSRQSHFFSGLGTSLSGEYYLARVNHTLSDRGYLIDFSARKVAREGAAPTAPTMAINTDVELV